MSEFSVVITTVDQSDLARKMADCLVESSLAACVQIHGPIFSVYRWQGQIQHSDEWVCWVKTRTDLAPALMELIKKIHGYEVPQIVSFPLQSAADSYAQWLRDVTLPLEESSHGH